MAIDNRYDEEDIDGAMSVQKGEITTLTQSNPTNNSKAHPRDNQSRGVPRIPHAMSYRQVDKLTGKQSTETRTEKSTYSTKILLKPHIESETMSVDRMVTKADLGRRLPSQAASTSQCHLPMTTNGERYSTEHSTKARESASALELGKYNRVKEDCVLDIDK
jgi:hypothetical protein